MKMLKKVLSFVLTISMIASLLVVPASAEGEFTVTAANGAAAAGETVKIDLIAANNPGFGALEVQVYYNKNALTCTNFNANKDASGNTTAWKAFANAAEDEGYMAPSYNRNLNDPTIDADLAAEGWGLATLGFIAAELNVDANGVLGCLTFTVASDVEDCDSVIRVEVAKAVTISQEPIAAAGQQGKIEIDGITPILDTVALSSASATANGTDDVTVQAEAFSAKGTDITSGVTWSVSPADQGVTVAADGTVTVDAKTVASDYTITAAPLADKSQGEAKSATLTVSRVASKPADMTFDITPVTVNGENDVTTVATVKDQYGDNITDQVAWTADDGVTVNGNGIFTIPAKAMEGTYTITASLNGGDVSVDLPVQRETSEVVSLELDKEADGMPVNGAKEENPAFYLVATVIDQFDDDVTAAKDSDTVWTVTPDDGKLSFNKEGLGAVKVTVDSYLPDGAQYTITATNNGKSDSFVMTANRLAAEAYELQVLTDGADAPDAVTIGIPGSKAFTAEVLDQFGNHYADAQLNLTGDAGITLNGSTVVVADGTDDNATATLTVSYDGLTSKTIDITAKAVEVDWSGIAVKESMMYSCPNSFAFTTLPATGTAIAYVGGEATTVNGTFEVVDPDTLLNVGDDQIITVKFTVTTSGAYAGSEFTKKYTIDIFKCPITISANSVSMTYGDAEAPAYGFMPTYPGLAPEVISYITDNVTYTTLKDGVPVVVNSTLGAGTYDIVPAFGDPNFDVTVENGTLTVNKKSVAVEWAGLPTANDPLIYNGQEQSAGISATYEGNTATLTFDQGAEPVSFKNAGTYTITAVDTTGNYALTNATASASIDKIVLDFSIVKADDKIYDATTSSNGAVYSLLTNLAVAGEDPSAEFDVIWTSPDAGTDTVNVRNIALTDEWTTNYCLSETSQDNVPAGTTIERAYYSGTITFAEKTVLSSEVVDGSRDYVYELSNVSLSADAEIPNADHLSGLEFRVATNGTYTTGAAVNDAKDTVTFTVPVAQAPDTTDTISVTVVSKNFYFVEDLGNGSYGDKEYPVTLIFKSKTDVSSELTLDPITVTYGEDYAPNGVYAGIPDATSKWTYTYNGSTIAPTAVGDYTITATYEDDIENDDVPGHIGTVTAALKIEAKTIGLEWKTAEGGADNYTGAYTYNSEIQGIYPVATGVLSGDTVNITVEGNTAEDVGIYTARATGLDNTNYTLPANAEKYWVINRKTVSVNDGTLIVTKVYDGTADAGAATGVLGLDGIIDGDELTVSGTIGAYADKKAAEAKTIIVSALTLDGADKDNYSIDGTSYSFTKASITKKAVTVTGIAAESKSYDGLSDAALNYESVVINGKAADDDLSVTAAGAFADKTVAAGKSVAISGITLAGADASNYELAAEGNQTAAVADITAKELTVTNGSLIITKEYDGTTDAADKNDANEVSGELSLTGVIGEDVVSVTFDTIGAYDAANYGTYTVTLSGVALNGADANNYTVADTYAFNAATITKTKPTAAQLTAQLPADAVYTGEAYRATVEANAEGLGNITVMYKKGAAAATTTAPVNAGTYTVIAKLSEGSNYAAWEVEVGAFTIAKADRDLSVGEAVILTPKTTTGKVNAATTTNVDNSARITYTSDSNTILVNSNGTISANGNGTATINVNIAATDNYNAVAKTVAVTAIMEPVVGMNVTEGLVATINGTKIIVSGIPADPATAAATPVLASVDGVVLTSEPTEKGFAVKMGDEVIETYTVDNSGVVENPDDTTITEPSVSTPAEGEGTASGIVSSIAKELVAAIEKIKDQLGEGTTVTVDVDPGVTVDTTDGIEVTVAPTYTMSATPVEGDVEEKTVTVQKFNAPITVTVTLPAGAATSNVMAVITVSGTKVYAPVSVDSANMVATWQQSVPGTVELIQVNDTIEVTFGYADGRTQTVIYTAANLGEVLPTDNSRSNFKGWKIDGTNYTSVTEELLALGGTKTAEPVFQSTGGTGGGGGGGAAAKPEKEETVWTFEDVPESHYWYETIKWAYENGYMNGKSETTFDPSATINRQQLWMVLGRLDDVDPTDMAAAKAWAMENGISDGSNAGNKLTRQQMVTMLWRYAQLRGYDVSVGEDTNILSYNDAMTVSEYAIPAMQWACGAGIVNGTTDGNLNPGASATRAQFAAILQRFVEKVVEG